MDVENMHPFCLPFGFCHDATSSSLNNNDYAAQQTSNGGDTTSNPNNNSNNNNNNNKDNKLNRSRTNSPSADELFRQLNNNTNSASLLNEDDIIIGSSTSTIGIGGSYVDVESFYSLELDLNGISEGSDVGLLDGTHQDGTDLTAFTDEDDLLDDDVNFIAASVADDEEDDLVISRNGTIDWYSSSCTKYSSLSLFSPTSNNNKSSTATKNGRRKSLIRQALLAGCNGNTTASHIHHNQVFHQHVVDPIDIKSSPTLAQLNLNSINDDPTDPWMDLPPPPGTNGAISSSTSILSSSTNHHHHHSQDLLLSNSTSILNNHQHHPHHHHPHHHHHHTNHGLRNSAATNGNSCTCNHLNHHAHSIDSIHHQQQSAHHKSLSSSPLTSHHHHQHNHDHQQLSTRFNCNNSNNGPTYHQPHHNQAQHQGSTCMAATSPFGRTDLNIYHQPYSTTPCCQHGQHELINTEKAIYGNNLNLHQNCNNLKSSTSLNQLNQQQRDSLLTTATSCTKSCLDEKQKLDQQQRSASPALVTSSSSPLSTSTHHPLGANTTLTLAGSTVMGASVNSNRMIDNKLKENIEYLTALLCDGSNKFDNNGLLQTQVQQQHQQHQQHQHQQQPQHPPQQPATTTSTMARSYATLAQSLSTGPKLLERQQLGLNNPQQPQHLQKLTSQLSQHLHCSLPNEASPCSHNNLQQQIPQNSTNNTQQSNTLKRPFSETSGNDQWFGNKQLPVETSVSAADSTDGHFSSLSNDKLVQNPNLDCSRQKTNELKVLSSLLNSTNKPQGSSCAGHPNAPPVQSVYSANTAVWQSSIQPNSLISVNGVELSNATSINTLDKGLQPTIATSNIPAQPQTKVQLDSSIPINGKPITLTPITNQASLIKQQQQQARNSLFIQPASPSASSTASSSNTANDPANLSSSVTLTTNAAKKQKTNNLNAQTPKGGINTNSSGNRAARPNSMSTDCSLSSHDEGFSSQVDNDDNGSMHDSDDDDDVDSDDESFYGDYTNSDLIGASISDNAENKWTLNMGRTRRNGQKRYFWQYNVQSKGPKGTRICSTDDSEDPFVLPEASDPVFSNDCQVEGVKHSGKARRGDGNDLTPNPRKLLMIGLELKKLGKIINDLAPVTDLPINARNKTRKEKNKLASRACRLKKKAQHEANKIKLYGLQREHQQVVLAIYDIRKLLNDALLERDTKESLSEGSNQGQSNKSCEQKLAKAAVAKDLKNIDSTVKTLAEKCSMNVAGQTSDYVNSVLEKVVSGCIDGGLQT